MVRHGETDANVNDIIQGQTDVPLNSNGLRQAQCVGRRLKDYSFDAIYSSDLSRAMVTAGYIANGRNIIPTSQLREWNLGAWEGKSINRVAAEFPEEHKLFKADSIYFRPTSGESTREFRDRAADFLSRIVQNHAGQTVLCVTHGGFLRMTLLNIMNMEKYPARARTDNTSVSCFRTTDSGNSWQLITWNDASHLNNDHTISSGW